MLNHIIKRLKIRILTRLIVYGLTGNLYPSRQRQVARQVGKKATDRSGLHLDIEVERAAVPELPRKALRDDIPRVQSSPRRQL